MPQRVVWPSHWDAITATYVRQHEPYPGYWEASERYSLKAVEKLIRGKQCRHLLDIGCGDGRSTVPWALHFDRVTALEPSDEHVEAAATLFAAKNLNNVTLSKQCIQESSFAPDLFDMVLCSHVIQHMPTSDSAVILDAIYTLLRPGGIAVILTSHSMSNEDSFVLERFDETGQKTVTQVVPNEEMFNRKFPFDPDAIPTHRFSISKMRGLMSRYCDHRIRFFHALHPRNGLDRFVFRDTLINLPCLRPLYGSDMIVLARKPAASTEENEIRLCDETPVLNPVIQ